MSEKSKSKAARRFGMKQMIQNTIFNIVLFAIVVAIGQVLFFYYTGLRWIPKGGGKEMVEQFETWSTDARFIEDREEAQAKLDECVTRAIRKRASINFPTDGSIKWELQSLGNFKGGNENMIERFDIKFRYPLKVEILGFIPFRNTFTGKAHLVTRMNSSLKTMAKPKEN